MQPNVFVHDRVELSRRTLSLRENLHQEDDLTHSKRAHTALDDLCLEDMLELGKLLHDARCHIPSNHRNKLAFIQATDVFLDKLFSFDAYHLQRDFMTTFAHLIMFGNHIHNGSKVVR